MRKFALLLTCAACTSHARQIHPAVEQDNDLHDPLKTFALLLASKSTAGFSTPGAGAHPFLQQKAVHDTTISTSHRVALDRRRGDWQRSPAARMKKQSYEEKFEPSERVKVVVETRNAFLQARLYFIQPVVIAACLLGSYISGIRILQELDVPKDATNLAINLSIAIAAIILEVKAFKRRQELLKEAAIEIGELEPEPEEEEVKPARPLTKKQLKKAAKKEAKKLESRLEKWGAPIETETTAEDGKTTDPIKTATTAEDGKTTD